MVPNTVHFEIKPLIHSSAGLQFYSLFSKYLSQLWGIYQNLSFLLFFLVTQDNFLFLVQNRDQEHLRAYGPAGHGPQGQRPGRRGRQAGHTQVVAGHTRTQIGADHTQVGAGTLR
jgi:hypothetical protein